MGKLNLGNSLFPGFNDQNGLMICGYEWGWSKADEAAYKQGEYTLPEEEIPHTFSNKALYYGEQANTWRYDNAIKAWFELWGHPLDSNGLGGAFERSVVQTNWANSQDNSISDYDKFLSDSQVDNFLFHLKSLRPKVILFMGSRLLDYLNNPKVLVKFKELMGEEVERARFEQKPFAGARFKVGFQRFQYCQIVCLPHPSASRGLSHAYIEMFRPEMDKILTDYKKARGF